MKRFSAALAASAFLMGAPAMAQTVDPNLPNYEAVSGVSGNLVSIGSDTLNNLMTLWSEGFRGFYPNVAVQIQGAGSGTAPPALVEGTAQFGPMSRPMRGTEIEEFEARYGYEPIPMRGAIDAHRRVRAPRQPDRVPQPAAGRCDLLVDPRWRCRCAIAPGATPA
jgi:phosphate transport system substrate-binding protein